MKGRADSLVPLTELSAGNLSSATTLRIAETFTSRQGEGMLTGVPSYFIRTSGCNLRCWFCDTPYASWKPEGPRVSIDELIDRAHGAEMIETDAMRAAIGTCESLAGDGPVRHIVLTGGEPLIARGIDPLCKRLRADGLHVTIETAGTVDVDVPCDLLSLSPKLRRSGPDAVESPGWAKTHEERRLPFETMRNLIGRSVQHQVKFVVDSPDEFQEIESVVESLGVDPGHIWIMPQGITNEQLDDAAKWLRPWCEEKSFNYCDRMQIRWYGNRRGT